MFRPQLLTEARIARGLEPTSKKRLLESLAQLLADSQPGLDADAVFKRLTDRERLGSTGLGHGIALPHARVENLSQAIGAFVSTAHGVDYDAADREPVDLAFALLVPEDAQNEHLEILAGLARRFNDPRVRQRLRAAGSAQEVLGIFAES